MYQINRIAHNIRKQMTAQFIISAHSSYPQTSHQGAPEGNRTGRRGGNIPRYHSVLSNKDRENPNFNRSVRKTADLQRKEMSQCHVRFKEMADLRRRNVRVMLLAFYLRPKQQHGPNPKENQITLEPADIQGEIADLQGISGYLLRISPTPNESTPKPAQNQDGGRG